MIKYFLILLYIIGTFEIPETKIDKVVYGFELEYWSELKGIKDFIKFKNIEGTVEVQITEEGLTCNYAIDNECTLKLYTKLENHKTFVSNVNKEIMTCDREISDIFLKLNEIFSINYNHLDENLGFQQSRSQSSTNFFRIDETINPGFGKGYEITGEMIGESEVPNSITAKFRINFPTSAVDNWKGGIIKIKRKPADNKR